LIRAMDFAEYMEARKLCELVERADMTAMLPYVTPSSYCADQTGTSLYNPQYTSEALYAAIENGWNKGLEMMLLFHFVNVNLKHLAFLRHDVIYDNLLECAIKSKNTKAAQLILGRSDFNVSEVVTYSSWITGEEAHCRRIEGMFVFAVRRGVSDIAIAIAHHPKFLAPPGSGSEHGPADEKLKDPAPTLNFRTWEPAIKGGRETVVVALINAMHHHKMHVKIDQLLELKTKDWRAAFAAALSQYNGQFPDLTMKIDSYSILHHVLPLETSAHGDDHDFFFMDKLLDCVSSDFSQLCFEAKGAIEDNKSNSSQWARALVRYASHPRLGNDRIAHLFCLSFPLEEDTKANAGEETPNRALTISLMQSLHAVISQRFLPSMYVSFALRFCCSPFFFLTRE
jgi:hypothetical protein